jgi:hypothetical protein
MSQYGKPFESAAAGGSPMELAYKNVQDQTNRQAELINNLRAGASRRKSRKSPKPFRALTKKTKKGKGKTGKKIKKGGAIPYSAPAHPTEPSNTKYPQGDLVKGLLQVGSQHQENSKYDSMISAAPAVYSSPDAVPKLMPGGKRHKKK